MNRKSTKLPPEALYSSDLQWLPQARAGDASAFDRLVAPYRRRLHTHCYRMLGSPHDADDALQETLLAAWRSIGSFEGRSAFGTWLHQISTHACLRLISRRSRRLMSPDHGPAFDTTADLGQMVGGPVWLEPLPDDEAPWHGVAHEDPAEGLARRESVTLAFIAALQHLPGTQRAVLLLRNVLEYSAAETADMLGTTVSSVNSALQRAQKTMKSKLPAVSQATELRSLGEEDLDHLLGAFVTAWESRNIDDLVRLFTEDVRFTMPPLPAWFDGLVFVQKFIAERVFATPWRLVPMWANGQAGFACYMLAEGDDVFRLGAILLLNLRAGRIAGLHSFLDPVLHRRFGLAEAMD
ncbi:RNA polymerase sigma-70 factor (ECF subfamily) [Hydrogenophaga palleronii]|uniref:RNA polymerase sigma-70 factor (ECF subfamily) n=1 Tax=Hydrogenophaga palleronii TaxID=65655 RepID=A0ABU1WM60_9BURK|nr:RNA polymerase subunit sigma-70 [Hydrogenophaga palleronii]MDR7150106.1 RNA polymerase sigma-70 factor (ECF subfamily) [Hydrogenophaga palleronii]